MKKGDNISTRLRALRQASGLTQVQLAVKAGIHLGHIRKLEQGQRGTNPSLPTLQKLAGALGTDLNAFDVS